MFSALYTIIISPLEHIIEFIYSLFFFVAKNPGLAIIGVSVGVTLFCLPLYAVAEKWQQRERDIQQKLKPKVDKIKKVFKGDEQYMILSTYYRQNNYHPIYALRSSFGLLIQIPFFIAAYNFLSHLQSLNGVSFLFIKDLGTPDGLIKIGNFSINFLPILMTLINCIAGAVYTKGLPVKEKLQLYGMALVFLVLLYTSPAGLVLYWTMNNVFSLVKNIYYKTKNPLKNFYKTIVVCCVVAIIALIFVDTSTDLKLIGSLFFAFVAAIPFIYKLIKPLFVKILQNFHKNTKQKNVIFFVSAISLALLAGLVIPTTLISTSVSEFSFIEDNTSPFPFIKNAFLLAVGLFLFWPTCFYFLFSKKVKTAISFIFINLLVFTLIDNYVFSYVSDIVSNTFVMTISKPSLKMSLLNILLLIVAFLLVLILIKKHSKILISASSIIMISFAFITTINCVTIKKDFAIEEKLYDEQISKIDPIYHLSKTEENVVVIMLDRAMTGFLPYLLEEKPELKEQYDGFVYFPNTVSFGRYTVQASAALWGGYEYQPFEINKRDNLLVEEQNQALKVLPKIFSDAGYNITYTDAPLANHLSKPDMSIMKDIDNVLATTTRGKYTSIWLQEHGMENLDKTAEKINRNTIWFSLLKMAPNFTRKYIYKNAEYLSASFVEDDIGTFIDCYSVLDYLPELTDFSSSTKACMFLDNETPHNKIFLSLPNYEPTTETVTEFSNTEVSKDKLYHTTSAAIICLTEWLDYLKDNDVYDNTRIIFVSDHGNIPGIKYDKNPLELHDEIRYMTNALLLVKDFNSRGPLTVDNTFMCNADVPFLATEGLIENPINPYTGNPITSKENKENGLILTSNRKHRVREHGKINFNISDDEWYVVKDNIFDNDNWSKLYE